MINVEQVKNISRNRSLAIDDDVSKEVVAVNNSDSNDLSDLDDPTLLETETGMSPAFHHSNNSLCSEQNEYRFDVSKENITIQPAWEDRIVISWPDDNVFYHVTVAGVTDNATYVKVYDDGDM